MNLKVQNHTFPKSRFYKGKKLHNKTKVSQPLSSISNNNHPFLSLIHNKLKLINQQTFKYDKNHHATFNN